MQLDQYLSLFKARVSLTDSYNTYYSEITEDITKAMKHAALARNKGLDPSSKVESKIVFDLSSRVEELIGLPGLSLRLRELMKYYEKEASALALAVEVASGRFGLLDRGLALEKAVRAGLAVITDGVTVAPLQGLSKITIKKNKDGSNYASLYFAGPIRSAGGTDAAFTLIIADEVRKVLGLDRYHVNDYDDEIGRFVEELRIYEREVGNFQYKVSDDDIRTALSYVPVEINGVETDPVELIMHRNLLRIEANKVRGGALRVLNDGLIGRARKLQKLVKELAITDWYWLSHISGGQQEASDQSHFGDAIAGRPILSFPDFPGGFRLRYGRCFNTGLAAVGINPASAVILDYALVTGSQIKLSKPGKSATVAFVDTIEGPVVKLKQGSVVKVEDIKMAERLKDELSSILFLGDILISFGDFVENNSILNSSAYVEELWAQDFEDACMNVFGNITVASQSLDITLELIAKWIENPQLYHPSFDTAFELSKKLAIPLHPRYLLFWDQLIINELLIFREALQLGKTIDGKLIIEDDPKLDDILEKLCAPYDYENHSLVFSEETTKIFNKCLSLDKDTLIHCECKTSLEIVSAYSGISIKNKSSSFIGVRLGRPEKAEERKMKPPVHVLFPIGSLGGPSRDLIKASSKTLNVALVNRYCSKCLSPELFSKCQKCGSDTVLTYVCPSCGSSLTEGEICPRCKIHSQTYSQKVVDLKNEIEAAEKNLGTKSFSPLKGVKGLTNANKQPENIAKGILRQKYGLQIYRDGTIRFDATNMPITAFPLNLISSKIEVLNELGYSSEELSSGKPIPIFVQDVILPKKGAIYLLKVSRFIDELLEKFYKLPSFYNAKKEEDLIGQLIVGIAPHTSVAVIGRIIGFSDSQVCLAHPFWHSAKRRDCDGDADSISLLLDILLNFSLSYIPSQIGGLMDTPLLLQPYIIASEVEDQSLSIDASEVYPRDFYEKASKGLSAREVSSILLIKHILKKKEEFFVIPYTHNTNIMFLSRDRNSLAMAPSFVEKIERQLHYELMIKAVAANDAIASILSTHLLPDILGNLKAFGTQKVRCKKCGEKYRRLPLKGVCLKCGGELQLSVTKRSVGKFLELTEKLAARQGVPSYIRTRVELAKEDFESLFGKEQKQISLTDFT